jgi:hypothetical protein
MKKKKDGWWVEVDDSDALMKVMKTCRTVRANVNAAGVRSVELENGKRIRTDPLEERRDSQCFGLPCGSNSSTRVQV